MEFVYSPPSRFLAWIVLDLADLDGRGLHPRAIFRSLPTVSSFTELRNNPVLCLFVARFLCLCRSSGRTRLRRLGRRQRCLNNQIKSKGCISIIRGVSRVNPNPRKVETRLSVSKPLQKDEVIPGAW